MTAEMTYETRLARLCQSLSSLEQGFEQLADQLILSTSQLSRDDLARLEAILHDVATTAHRCHDYAEQTAQALHQSNPSTSGESAI